MLLLPKQLPLRRVGEGWGGFPGQLYTFSIASLLQFLISHSGRQQMHLTHRKKLPAIGSSNEPCKILLYLRRCSLQYMPRFFKISFNTMKTCAPWWQTETGCLLEGIGGPSETYGVRTHSSRIHPPVIHVSCLTEWINGTMAYHRTQSMCR